MSVATQAYRAVHKTDPKQEILSDLKGWIEDVEPTGSDFLVCVYERPEGMTMKSGAGLLLPATSSRRAEDKFQGFVGLIVKEGPNVEEHAEFFRGKKMPTIGDWVAFRVMDTTPFTLGARAMRMVQANFVRLVLETPDCVV